MARFVIGDTSSLENQTESAPKSQGRFVIGEDATAPLKKEARKPFFGEEIGTQGLIGGAKGILSGPGNLISLGNEILNMIPGGKESESARKEVFNLLSPLISQMANSEQVNKIEEGLFGEKLKPTTREGRIARKIGEGAGQGLTTGGIGAVTTGALSSGTGQAVRELGLPEGWATTAEIVTGLGKDIVKKISGKHVEGSLAKSLNPGQKAIYDRMKDIGLSDADITPILQSEKKISALGTLAKKTDYIKKVIKESKEAIGNLFNPVKQQAKAYGNLTQEQLSKFHVGLKKDLINLEKTFEASENKKEAIAFLKNAIEGGEGSILNAKGEPISYKFKSPEDIINFFQDINEQGLWNKLKPVKDTIMKNLHEIDPKLAARFEATNEAATRLHRLQGKIGLKDDFEKAISFGERLGLVASLGKFVIFGSNPWLAAGILGERLSRQVAAKMLTDPRWQGIMRNTVKSAEKGSKAAAQTTYNQFKNKVKEDFPEDYDSIDWPN